MFTKLFSKKLTREEEEIRRGVPPMLAKMTGPPPLTDADRKMLERMGYGLRLKGKQTNSTRETSDSAT